jgi:NADH:ubiquinone oxidoreductase subunit E
MKKPFEQNAPYQPANFAFKDMAVVAEIISRYPEGRQQSAVMPLLDLAQRQMGEEGNGCNFRYFIDAKGQGV